MGQVKGRMAQALTQYFARDRRTRAQERVPKHAPHPGQMRPGQQVELRRRWARPPGSRTHCSAGAAHLHCGAVEAGAAQPATGPHTAVTSCG